MGLFQNYQLFDIVIVAAAVAIIAGAISILLRAYTLFRAAIQFSWWIIELFPTTISNAHTLHKISNKNRNNRLQDSVESFCKCILKLWHSNVYTHAQTYLYMYELPVSFQLRSPFGCSNVNAESKHCLHKCIPGYLFAFSLCKVVVSHRSPM